MRMPISRHAAEADTVRMWTEFKKSVKVSNK